MTLREKANEVSGAGRSETNVHQRCGGVLNNSAVLALWGRPLATFAGVVFVISLAFPVVGGLSKDTRSFPKLWGVLDVAIAFVLVILAFAIITLAGGNVDKPAENRSYPRVSNPDARDTGDACRVLCLWGSHRLDQLSDGLRVADFVVRPACVAHRVQTCG
jgi:hypothetical protein